MRHTLKFKINLGPPAGPPQTQSPNPSSKNGPQNPGHYRSRFGCAECKRRRVKCDETFPVCLRCQRRGDFCESTPRLRQWQVEAPSLFRPAKASKAYPRGALTNKADSTLLRYWLEKASQIMVIDPDVNPLSFPILEYVERCPSLVHAMQSVGAAHKNFFNPSKLAKPLEERNLAIGLLRRELTAPSKDIFPVFITILLLGLSSAWIEGPEPEVGQQHLCGARALIDTILSDPALRSEQPSAFNFMLGAYLYWDMSCAHLVPSHQQKPIDNPDMLLAVLDVGPQYHPIGGYCTEVFYVLGNVLRYYRSVVDTGVRNQDLEGYLRRLLLDWKPISGSPAQDALCEAFRSHGLINLALCGRMKSTTDQVQHPPTSLLMDTSSFPGDDHLDISSLSRDNYLELDFLGEPLCQGAPVDGLVDTSDEVSYGELGISTEDQYTVMRELDTTGTAPDLEGHDAGHYDAVTATSGALDGYAGEGNHSWEEVEELTADPQACIRDQAIQVVRSLTAISSSHANVNLHSIPLLTAASELTADDQDERCHAIRRFRELYSLNRIQANLTCIRLLEQLWELRDAGEEVTWLELMLRTGGHVMLG